ncbi:MAG: HNH endonuclease [Methylococcaceae bacterium]
MPRCAICLQERTSLKFRTGRLSICSYCVSSLNKTALSAREAKQKWIAEFREGILHNQPDAIKWIDKWLNNSADWILAQKLSDPESVCRSHTLKVLRAHKSGIVCWNREYLDYPKNWYFKRFRTKHWDKYACYICGAKEEDNAELHIHHIVFRSKSGTNSYRNLVTLCYRHHQAQHNHEISTSGGEPPGRDVDQSVEQIDSLWEEQITTILPVEFSEQAYSEARPTFEAARDAFLSNGKTARELFVFLIQTFGRNVGRYALKFAEEEKQRGRWFKKAK